MDATVRLLKKFDSDFSWRRVPSWNNNLGVLLLLRHLEMSGDERISILSRRLSMVAWRSRCTRNKLILRKDRSGIFDADMTFSNPEKNLKGAVVKWHHFTLKRHVKTRRRVETYLAACVWFCGSFESSHVIVWNGFGGFPNWASPDSLLPFDT